MADTIKKIGKTNTPTTMDYTTLASWIAAIPADLVADAHRQIGDCYNQGNLDSDITFSGHTTDVTNSILLRAASGQGFRDNASVRSNPLTYDSTTGIAIEVNDPYHEVIQISDSYVKLLGLQIRNTNAGGISAYRATGGTNHVVDSCIIKQGGGSTRAMLTVINSVIITDSSGPSEVGGSSFFYNVTIVRTGTAGGTAFVNSNYSSPLIQNCAIFNFTTLKSGSAFAAGSDYNATDLATAFGVGTHNLNSLTYASQFVSTTDWRAVNTGSLKAGTPDATNAPTDITALTRDATTPYIGAWEVASSGAAFIARPPYMKKQAVNRASTY